MNMSTWLMAVALVLAPTAAVADSAGGKFESVLGFVIGKATLSDITAKLGVATRFSVPEGHHEMAICYEAKRKGPIVVFSTDGEFGGQEETLLGFSVSVRNERHYPCAPLPPQASALTSSGLELGLTVKDFESVVPPPLEEWHGSELIRRFEWQHPSVAGEDPLYVEHTVWGRFAEGRLVSFGCWKVETT